MNLGSFFSFSTKEVSTPEEIKDSRAARATFKQTLDSLQSSIDSWIKKHLDAGYQPKDVQPLLDRWKQGQSWYLTNRKLFAQEYYDQNDIIKADIEELYKDIEEKGPSPPPKEDSELEKKIQEKIPEIPIEWSDASTTDIVKSAWKSLYPYLLAFLIIGIILRIATVFANQHIYKPVPFRIHAFVWGIFMSPYLLILYTIKYIRWRIGKGEPFVIESMIPLTEVSKPIENMFDMVTQWYRNPVLAAWIEEKQKKELNERQEVLGSPAPKV